MDADESTQTRRSFLGGLGAAALLADGRLGTAWADEISRRLARGTTLILDHDEAVAEGIRRGIGTVEVVAPQRREVQAAGTTSFTFKYRTGNAPIGPGGFIWFAMRHLAQCSVAQITGPKRAGFVTVQAPAGVEIEIMPWYGRPDKDDLFHRAFPWQNPIELRIKAGTLNPGDEVVLNYGDRSQGGPGVQMQAFQEPDFAFRIYVATAPDQPFLPLANDIGFPITGGPPDHLHLIAPACATVGSTIALQVRVEDKWSNQASGYSGDIVVTDGEGHAVARVSMTPRDTGLASVEVAAGEAKTVLRFNASDGTLTALSNPTSILDKNAPLRTLFGEIHGHTAHSDGRGTPEGYFRYAREVTALDFCALTDHDYMMTDEMWAQVQAAAEAANAPGKFVTIQAYEWSGMTEVGGDHNVYFRGTRTKLYRCRSYYDYRNQQSYHGAQPQINHIEDLYDALLAQYAAGEVMVIPHYGGRQANSKWHHPQLERFVEMYSEHRRSNEWASEFLRRGYRLGIAGGGDDHIGRPGNGFIFNPLVGRPVEISAGLIAVLAPEATREAVFDAMYKRHVYATTGERILLEFSMGDAIMGDEIAAPGPLELVARAQGTAPVTAMEVWKDTVLVSTSPANALSAALSWTDPSPPAPGQTAMYWVRVLQANAEEATSSPIWWTRT